VSSRAGIHYWKCDRAAALHGTTRAPQERAGDAVMAALAGVLPPPFGGPGLALRPAGSQGNHLTFIVDHGAAQAFVRVEDGPEGDDYLEVESALLVRLRAAGIAVPAMHYCDAGRQRVPFAFHVLGRVEEPDLNTHFKAGRLEIAAVFAQIGSAIARWQAALPVHGCGPFDIAAWRAGRGFTGLHANAPDYFFLNLDRHLAYLVRHAFLTPAESAEIARLLDAYRPLIADTAPVLVHKDMALWNVMGTPDRVTAFIDWDDACGGDPMDDLSLLACFHDAAALDAALSGYASVRPLPPAHQTRFWLHLVRNLVVKAVIRTGAGYFERDGSLFLNGAGGGAALREFTRTRLRTALAALETGAGLAVLG
jgi:fructosamine-3-kinase